jgi:hypothetical protein
LVALRRRLVEIAPRARSDVAGDALLTPAEIVGGRDVGEEIEAEFVAQVTRSLGDPRRVDDDCRLPVCLAYLDDAGNAVEIQDATPRIS